MIRPLPLFFPRGVEIRKVWWMARGKGLMTQNHPQAFICHPYDYVMLVQHLEGSIKALDVLKPILHERIDQIFSRS